MAGWKDLDSGVKSAVIGAGYAGLAAAVEIAAAGRPVEVFEASRVLGGRARATQIAGFSVDNGQHILVGAYTETLRLMRAVGANPDHLLRRIPVSYTHLDVYKRQLPTVTSVAGGPGLAAAGAFAGAAQPEPR